MHLSFILYSHCLSCCFLLAVVYDGCPRSFSHGLWWERTPFGKIALESCPSHSQGKASRACDETLGGWQGPDLFNCTSDPFLDLRKVVSCSVLYAISVINCCLKTSVNKRRPKWWEIMWWFFIVESLVQLWVGLCDICGSQSRYFLGSSVFPYW